MKTVIANDRIGRFAELDHTVLEEVQAIMESPAADAAGQDAADHVARPAGWLRTTLQKAVRARRAS
jgi:hypothetical protein